eukprot:TRINITY_DN15443_c0_g1_i1.p1 TRINITY_DN15443_c0_g1~~TRINITY_DN15443_c0_g1_i1.p1  ORF type:complete len:456 (-),score=68.83 TRINITY_DN15443_c0_g1_i1:57-1424(-)
MQSEDGGEKTSTPVRLHIYDVSQGMASNYSQPMLGMKIDGIWHTGIVAYGKEFYFGSGITADSPGCTPFGKPLEVLEIGKTTVPLRLLSRFLDALQGKYVADTYHLLDNNCNNFTADLSMFLTEKSIPEHIVGLPERVLASPLGKLIRPLIDNMERLMSGSTNPGASPNTANTGSVLLVNSAQKALFPLADVPAVTMKLLAFHELIAQGSEGVPTELALSAEDRLALEEFSPLVDEGMTIDPPEARAGLTLLDKLVLTWPEQYVYPALDLIRVIAGRQPLLVTKHYCKNPRALDKLLKLCSTDGVPVYPAVQLMTLKLCCNLSSCTEGSKLLFGGDYVGALFGTVANNLLHDNRVVLLTAASVVFNCASLLHLLQTKVLVSLLAGLMHAVPRLDRGDRTCTFRVLLALGVLMWNNPVCHSLVRLKSDFSVDLLIDAEDEEIRLIAWEVKCMIDLG